MKKQVRERLAAVKLARTELQAAAMMFVRTLDADQSCITEGSRGTRAAAAELDAAAVKFTHATLELR